MERYHSPRIVEAGELDELTLPGEVQLALDDLAGSVREGLLALSVGVGLKVLDELLEEELAALVGPKGTHNPERTANRHGSRSGRVVLGGRKVSVRRPRARSLDGRELRLRTYAHFASDDLLSERTVETMLAGLSTRRHRRALEPTGTDDRSVSKSAVSRRFVARTRRCLAELMARPVPDDLLVLMLDGVQLAGHTCLCALAIRADGSKVPLGLWEGATENAAVATALLSDLVDRGLDTSQGVLCVIDGAKALRKAIRDVLGGRKVSVRRPRARTREGRELRLRTYARFASDDLLSKRTVETMLAGLSTRRHRAALEPTGTDDRSVSKSAVSRRFVERTRRCLAELMARPVPSDLVVLMLDGVQLAGHTCLCALAIRADGTKVPLGLWEGASENAAVCRRALADLGERGLTAERGLLVVIDGSKALRSAVGEALGAKAAVQRCRRHKEQNVLGHLPEGERPWVKRKLREAWMLERAELAERRLLELARTLATTNPIESMLSICRERARNVKRWRGGEMAMRWTAAGMLDAERSFRRVKGFRGLPQLAAALRRHAADVDRKEVRDFKTAA